MKVGILYNKNKKDGAHYAELLKNSISDISARELCGTPWTVIESSDYQYKAFSEADILISVGGDGTFLKTAAASLDSEKPVLGFNLGTLGLLTEFDKNDIEGTVTRLVRGDYIIEERMTLYVSARDKSGNIVFSATAVNDCVLARGGLAKVAYIDLLINGTLADTYPCDGIIVSTQTGSTAYSLSAGGPIVEPGNDVIVITPICAHYTDGRSIIARPSSVIEMKMRRAHKQIYISVDGHDNFQVEDGIIIRCERSNKKVRIIRIAPPNFYEALRKKASERREKIHNEE